MRIRVIMCQNAVDSGTPDQSRKAPTNFQQRLYHYVCEEYSESKYFKDLYDGYKFHSAFDFEVAPVNDKYKKDLLGQLASKGNSVKGPNNYVTKGFFQTEANELLKSNKWMVNEEAVQASSKLRK